MNKALSHPKPRPLIPQPDDPSIRLIPLTRDQVAIVDADKYEWAMQWNWYAQRNRTSYYAARREYGGGAKYILMHRQLMNEPDGQVDHINNDGLDNRMQNLRPATHGQNQANHGLSSNNTSGVTGVYQYRNKWCAEIKVEGKKIRLGMFDNKEDAVVARTVAELELFGEFAPSALELMRRGIRFFPQPLPPATYRYGGL